MIFDIGDLKKGVCEGNVMNKQLQHTTSWIYIRCEAKACIADMGAFFIDSILDEANGILNAFIFLFSCFCLFCNFLYSTLVALFQSCRYSIIILYEEVGTRLPLRLTTIPLILFHPVSKGIEHIVISVWKSGGSSFVMPKGFNRKHNQSAFSPEAKRLDQTADCGFLQSLDWFQASSVLTGLWPVFRPIF